MNTHLNLTHPKLKRFDKRFGTKALKLAAHAAFPLALTPELLYCIRENFVPECDWFVVGDILLLLCDSVGYHLYEFPSDIRHELLKYLKDQQGEERLYQLSDFMIDYIRANLPDNDRISEDLGAAPHWTALAYVKPQETTQQIAQWLHKIFTGKNREQFCYTSPIIEGYSEILNEWGFEPLLILSRAYDAEKSGDTEDAQEQWQQLGKPGDTLEVAGVTFTIGGSPFPPLKTFSFETVTVNRRGEIINTETHTAQYFTENLSPSLPTPSYKQGKKEVLGIDMIAIPGGTFLMGAAEGEKDASDDEYPQHLVTVPPFLMGKYPITQEQWQIIAENTPKIERDLDPNPSRFEGHQHPVERVSWLDAVEFCLRLSKLTGKAYRLPTEAEWEYACRAGTTTPFYFGDTLTGELANYNASYTYADEPKGEYRAKTTPVGQFPPNAFGLYDMHGNVYEWCADDWHNNYNDAPKDGSAWIDDQPQNSDTQKESKKGKKDENLLNKVLSGGSWTDYPRICRSANRISVTRAYQYDLAGFRVVCEVART